MAPLRAVPVFGAAVTVSEPAPVPVPDPLMVNHEALLVAVHEHPVPA